MLEWGGMGTGRRIGTVMKTLSDALVTSPMTSATGGEQGPFSNTPPPSLLFVSLVTLDARLITASQYVFVKQR